jgi:hypothetical protein
MWETLGPYFFGAGAAFLLVGLVKLIAAAFRYHLAWGLATLLILPAPLFVLWHFRKALGGLLVMVLGVVVAAAPIVINRLVPSAVDLGPRERTVNGELHITLTGWQPEEGMSYAVLKARPDTVVLQMANEDVTDQTLENLRGLKKLRVLDLSSTQVTDEGLKVLQELRGLQVLRLNRTKITDEGVRDHIFPITSLKELNVSNTRVTRKTRDEWKARGEGRKVVPAF